MQHIKQITMAALVLGACAGLAACGSLSHDIAADGGSAGQLVWPAPGDVSSLHEDGTWPTLASLREVQAGMNKPQVMALIGPPQFDEGWHVREWDYLFHLRSAVTGKASTCQYKVLFDEHKLARSFYWKPARCADLLKPMTQPEPVVAKAKDPPPTVRTIDALFAFNKSGLGDISAAGRIQLHRLVGEIKQSVAAGGSIVVNGYAGRIGTDATNQALSQKRADTVRGFLIGAGVPAVAIKARGQGTDAPIAVCPATVRTTLIACLAPNRRVEIVVTPKI